MANLLNLLGPWGLLFFGLVLGLVLGGIPLIVRANRLQLEIFKMREAQAAKQASAEDMKLQMQVLANDVLQKNSQAFLLMAEQKLQQQSQVSAKDLEKRQEGISALLKPLKESVDLYRQQTQSGQGALKQEIANLSALGQDMSRQAAALRSALTSSPKGVGAWGEQQLKNVMTMSGMAEHVDFDLQTHVVGQEGQRLRPDARINLPGGGSIVVDAKAPLEAFINAHDAHDAQREEEAAAHLQDYARALRGHITDLGKKAYWDQFDAAPEFVVLFLPNDKMLMTAFDQRPDLLEWALEQKVILASPSTLIALLTTVAHGWRQDSLAQNAQEIAILGKELYDSMAALGEHYDKVGVSIQRSAKAYNDMIGSVERRVMPRARKFRDLQLNPGLKSVSEPTQLGAVQVDRPRTGRDLKLSSNSDIVDQTDPAQIASDD